MLLLKREYVDILKSIKTLDRVYDTGQHPILIMCNNFDDYVCKYPSSSEGITSLTCEYIGYMLLKEWGLLIIESAFIKLNQAHIPPSTGINSFNTNRTCFGSKFNCNYQDLIDRLYLNMPYSEKHKHGYKCDYLKIALFDIWVANEDRHFNNPNILLDVGDGYRPIPIDHGAIFNTHSFNLQITELTSNETIISSNIVKSLFSRKDFEGSLIDDLRNYFYLCVSNCSEKKDEILNNLPPDWSNLQEEISKKLDEIFRDEWIKNSFNLFLSIINDNLR